MTPANSSWSPRSQPKLTARSTIVKEGEYTEAARVELITKLRLSRAPTGGINKAEGNWMGQDQVCRLCRQLLPPTIRRLEVATRQECHLSRKQAPLVFVLCMYTLHELGIG